MNKTSSASFQAIADIAAKDFAEAIINDDKFVETMQELTLKFVKENITFVDEETHYELALALFDRLNLTTY